MRSLTEGPFKIGYIFGYHKSTDVVESARTSARVAQAQVTPFSVPYATRHVQTLLVVDLVTRRNEEFSVGTVSR
jgi:hypothetical protein